jgi:DNA-binding CsgD family transcriptional regulator
MKNHKYPNLMAELTRNGVGTNELAILLKMSRQNVYNKLNGKVPWTLREMEIVRKWLSITDNTLTLDYIFKEKGA